MNKNDFKYASYVYKIEALTPEFVKYRTLTDMWNEYLHEIKPKSTFPYKQLQVGQIYTIICVLWKHTWHFLFAWNLEGAPVIVNTELQTHMDEVYGEHIDYK